MWSFIKGWIRLLIWKEIKIKIREQIISWKNKILNDY